VKVALDARAYGWAGIGRYIGNFLQALSRAGGRHQFIVLTGQRNAEQISQVLPKDHFRVSVVDDSYYGWREQTLFLRQLWAVRADLFHFMHFNVPLLFRRRYVVTVHDATRFIFPGQTQQTLVKQLVYERVFQRAVTGAAGVVCVSEATRQELLSLPLRLPRLVRVVPEAAEPIFRAPVSRRARERARLLLGSSDPYLLYVGVWMNHKNLPRLLAAYVRVIERYPRLKLVITGRPRRGYVRVDYLARALDCMLKPRACCCRAYMRGLV
jgi:glycosyltransferase involved in cell wall biosynthesis